MQNGVSEKDFLILILDDDDGNRFAVRATLKNAGYRTIEAQSGRQAIELAQKHKPDLAILDVGLPDMSGYEVGRVIKKQSESMIVPVLHISATYIGVEAKVKGLDFGADGYLTHPIEPLIVISTVRALLRIRQAEKERHKTLLELRKKQTELEQTSELAREANFAKTRFLANMSHEIRTPLGAILGCAELLSDEKSTPEDRAQYIGIIQKSGSQLSGIINDILDLSKIEAGRMDIENVPVALSDLVAYIEGMFSSQARQKGIRYIVEKAESVPENILTDPTRLKQLVTNIVGNAIKFTTDGGVTVKIDITPNQKHLRFTVTDTGPGIDRELWEKLFEPFTQGDISMTRKFGGTGLGLGLARRLARALGGDVVIENSHPNSGCTFVITVNCLGTTETISFSSRIQNFRSGHVPSVDLKGTRVLLVEDAPENQFIIGRALKNAGAQVEIAQNGFEGISKALDNFHDVVLMDLQMPELDGMQATKELRKKGYSGPIIALTAHAMKEERQRCLTEGFDGHISKPVNFAQLMETISFFRSIPKRTHG